MRCRAEGIGRQFIDAGTDSTYPFYDDYQPTQDALQAAGEMSATARSYPSSYGLMALRVEVASFLHRQFTVELNPAHEVMITAGASQAFDALSRSYAGRYVLLPHLALNTVESVAVGNGAVPIRVPLDRSYRMDPVALDEVLRTVGGDKVRFLYLNSPTNPSGAVYGRRHLARIVETAKEHGAIVLHDHDSWFTSHCGERAVSILEIPGAMDVAITVLSVSKEFGLPGLRIGAVAGAARIVDTLRIHNSQFSVMLPELCQYAAAAALRGFHVDASRERVQGRITASLESALHGLSSLGWPAHAVLRPSAGYKFLFRPPPSFRFGGEPSGVELFDYLIARDASVKLSTSRSFNADDFGWMRMILMQESSKMAEIFARLKAIGVRYDMAFPATLRQAYEVELAGCDFSNL